MAGRTLPVNRSRTSLDQERENFEKNQTVAISKAVNEIEAPVKAKHVRSTIIGTFQAKGSQVFWSIIVRLPIHSNPIIAWKFCHTLHKVLREGHPNVLKDSQTHREFLVDKGKLWGHFKDGYGKLIYLYCRLLVVKLDFHRRNPKFPGNLMIKDQDLDLACELDINLYFQLSVELLDYMDEILALQAAVFGSLDMSRSNSMTNAGQCRLAPLIPCIQDSSQVYDFIVKLLFKLHNCLPPDTLEGHRIRFLKQFKGLRQFYLQSSTLQYFKTLIQVPYLDESPPNFLISSELSRHVTPVVILPEEIVQPQVDGNLVQLEPDLSERNGSVSPDLLFERDRYIEQLLDQLEQLSAELNKIRVEYNQATGELREEILNLELRLSEKESEIEEALKQKEDIERKLSEAAQSAQIGSVVQLQLDEMGKRAKGWEDKFLKLKDVYQKLRDEHIKLLRLKGDVDKKLSAANIIIEENNKIQCELQDSLGLVKASLKDAEDEINTLRTTKDEEFRKLNDEKKMIQETNDQLNMSVSTTRQKVEDIEAEILHLQEEKAMLLSEKNQLKEALDMSVKEKQELTRDFEELRANSSNIDTEFAVYKTANDAVIVEITKEKEDLLENRNQLQGKCENLEMCNQIMEREVSSLNEEKENFLSEINQLKDTLDYSVKEKQELMRDFEELKASSSSVDTEFAAFKITQETIIDGITKEKEELLDSRNQLQAKCENLEQCKQIMEKEVNILKEEKEKLNVSVSVLETDIEQIKINSLELSGKLEQSLENGKKKDEELNAYKTLKETIIMELTSERDELKTVLTEIKETASNLEQQVQKANVEKGHLEEKAKDLLNQIKSQTAHYDSLLDTKKNESIRLFHQLLVDCCLKSELYLEKCVADLSKPPLITSSVQDQSGFNTKTALSSLKALTQSLIAYRSSNKSEDAAFCTIPLIFPFAQSVGYVLLYGQQLAHSLPDIDKADELLIKCVAAGKFSVSFFRVLQQPFQSNEIEANSQQIEEALKHLDDLVDAVTESLKASADQGNVGEKLENELGAMERAIEEAAARIAKLWDNSKQSQTGVKLEVNEMVLDSCTSLMKAIVDLIRKAKVLQEEIVARGKGSASAREFYKRNHRWTEGLLSAAKAVGFGAKLLTDAADNVVKGHAKFEQLTVASQEIAASTAQLVFASRVKAELQSKNLQALTESSRAVSLATGGVVATAKHCAELIEDSTVLDFAHLTLHQAKRLEMESQVKLLELESLLEKERLRLSALRRQHYQLAGETDA